MPNLVVVAIPSADDPVWKISSEKVPHMTLLFLGEMPVPKFADIAGFVQHAASQSLRRFGMEVDRRSTLGDEKADALFFAKSRWAGYESVAAFRSFLLQDSNIQAAYQSVKQFPEWIPHLTLGYPDTPAKPDNRDYSRISYVDFDRIALWFNDYEGFEYPLKAHEWDLEVAMSGVNTARGRKETAKILQHFGVKGMKWGVVRRRDQALFKKAGEVKAKTKEVKKLAKADAKYEKHLSGTNGYINMHNLVADHINAKIPALNDKPKYRDADLYNDKKLYGEYLKDYEKVVEAACRDATKAIGPNPSGTKQVRLTRYGEGEAATFRAELVDIKHADSLFSFRIIPKFNKTGKVIGQTIELVSKPMEQTAINEFVEDFLEHYGVKGMRWGVRKKRTATAVTVTQKGKKLKAKGGENQTPSSDAITAKSLEQVIKKSGVQALSNDHLRVYNERLNLEANANRLRSQNVGPGQKFVKELLGVTSDVAMQDIKNRSSAAQVKSTFTASSPSTSTALVVRR